MPAVLTLSVKSWLLNKRLGQINRGGDDGHVGQVIAVPDRKTATEEHDSVAHHTSYTRDRNWADYISRCAAVNPQVTLELPNSVMELSGSLA